MDDDSGLLRPRLTPIADLTPENLQALINDMAQGPGWYASADLYNWYVGMTLEADLAPVTKKKFGTTLKNLGYRNSIRRVAGTNTRCWYITRRAERGVPPRADQVS